MNQHRLVINREVVAWDYNSTKTLPPEVALKYQLMYQMSRITRDRGALSHDDRLDCLSMAVGYWVEQMGQDVDKRIEARQEGMLNTELKAWNGMITTTNLMALNKGQSMTFSFSNMNMGDLGRSMTDNQQKIKTWVN